MALVETKDVTGRLPETVLPLSSHNEGLVALFLDDAESFIREEFQRENRDLDVELVRLPWLSGAASRVIREMVAAAIIVGPNAGMRSASSATGQESDSATFEDPSAVSFGGVALTEAQRKALGLGVLGRSQGSFPPSRGWPEWVSR